MNLRILHTNDMHGSLNEERLLRLRKRRADADLYFDTGDAIRTGNLGIPLKPEPVWLLLSTLGCTASVLGNRETHVLESAFRAKLAGAAHPVLCANLERKDGSRPLPATHELTVNGLRVGLVGVMVPMVTARMKTRALSEFLWQPPLSTAERYAEELRPRVDLLIALTHIGHRQDLELASQCPLFDVILGGHSHTVVKHPIQVGRTYVCQGGSHLRYVGVYEWDGALHGGLQPL